MAGEIATAYLAIAPSMQGFGASAARQIGPQATALGARAGRQAGAAFTSEASKESENWFASTAKGAVKNVTLYGSMYAIITNVQRGISAMFGAMIGFNAQIEQSTIGFETMLGSSKAAEAQMQWIKDFARETPFQYGDLVGYSQQLLALGFNAEMAKDVLAATGDAAAALGRGSESIQRINLALGQMWTKGKVQSQEMLQLTEAGIAGWQILAEAYGTSVELVQEAVTAGDIKAAEAVPALLEGMNARFGGLMERQSQTYAGVLSNVQDTLQQQLAKAGEPLFAELTIDARKLLDALDDPEVVKTMNDIGSALADGAHFLAESVGFAWQYRDVIIEVGIAIAASQLLSKVPIGSMLSASTWFSANEAQRAYAAGLKTTTALRAGLTDRGAGALVGFGKVAGILGVVDGYRRVSEAGAQAEISSIGVAEAVGGAALAGAAFGSVIPGIGTAAGAAIGAVAGLAVSVWSYQEAVGAANKDTSLAKQAIQDLGVDANIAALALAGVTNAELDAVGGIVALRSALKEGTFPEYLANIKAQADAATAAANSMALSDTVDVGAINDASEAALRLQNAYKVLADNADLFSAASGQATSSAYANAYAADLQTGALGAMTQAAWDAVVAQGGLAEEALTATLRMEGLAGVAGFATQMIAGIPTGTSINFNTNASDILQQITALTATIKANEAATRGYPSTVGDYYQKEMNDLKAAYGVALGGMTTTLSLPSSGKAGKKGSSAAAAAEAAAKAAAEAAARKLEQDKAAQLRFADAFGSLMQAALEGKFAEYRDKLEEQITSLTRDGYTAAADALKKQSVALTQAALDYAALTNKLKAAGDEYDDLTDKMRDQYNTSRDLISGLGKATDAQSFDQLAYLLGMTTSKALEYEDVLTQLKNQGLSEDLWNQLAQAGPESMGLAQSILQQGAAGIEELNSLSGGLLDAADSMGTLVKQAMYQQGVDAMKAYIEGLESQSTALEAQLETIANNVLNQTAGAITPGNAGYSLISAAAGSVVNEYNLAISAESLGDLASIQEFIAMLEAQATTQLVNQAGTVTA